ncbi:MAG TPA: glycosyltransferase [Candidatus Cloacimonadota bacterium]|nr:glycosyltransferase [Candidatus Cloacimonadota bacterium]
MNLKFAVIICTYMRPRDILNLMKSIQIQTVYPDEILVVDGSLNSETERALDNLGINNLKYFFVNELHRGAAKQRNFGIEKVSSLIDIVCFLDDDVVLLPNYFEELIRTYKDHPDALGVGGYIIDDVKWEEVKNSYKPKVTDYVFDGWKTKESTRNIVRKCLGLGSDTPPGIMPSFSHGRSLFPPTLKTYRVEQMIGCTSSYRKVVLDDQQFDSFFEGYSLYEDTALALRVSKRGNLYLNTKLKLYHFHSPSGRPNSLKYGKMVVRNGWYVWRVKHPNPSVKSRIKWHTTTLLLTYIRLMNIITGPDRKVAFMDFIGRTIAWFGVLANPPGQSE